MPFSFRIVRLHEFASSSNWCLHPWENDYNSSELKSSIIRTGIIHPPFLLPLSDGRFEIVSGRKRLLIACGDLHLDKLGCFVLTDDVPMLSVLDLLLTDQIHTGPLSYAEKAQFIKIALRYITKEKIIEQFSERLEIRKQPSVINEMLAILDLPIDIITEIHSGRLQNRMIMELLRLRHAEDRLTMVSFFKELSLGGGKQRKFFSLIRDLACRNRTSIADYMDSDEIQRIIKHREMNIPQKVQHLGSFLQRELTPSSQAAEDRFTILTKSLGLPENISLDHSPAFETDEVTLSIRCKNIQECKEIVPEIKTSMKNAK